ncbi:energy transducer TonB [Stenotrophomonas rhizophila]|uniref:energy transducer TonB n=1 Tax=Stenotrophomonas rhizophila TaxID=216778 RepID=UPI003394911C
MKRGPLAVVLAMLVAGCASHPSSTTVDTRAENVDHQRLDPNVGAQGSGKVETYQLGPTEGYRMPQLNAGPDPAVGDRDPRRALAPTTVCLQLVIDAEGKVERSLPVIDRSDCAAGNAPENAPLMQAAQEAVAMWRFVPAAVCHFPPQRVPTDRGNCEGAERIELVAVSLLYGFTFEIVKGQHVVRGQGR